MKKYKFVILAWIVIGAMSILSMERVTALSVIWLVLFILLGIYYAQRHIAESKDLCDPTEENPNLCSCRKKEEEIIQYLKFEAKLKAKYVDYADKSCKKKEPQK